MVVATVVMCVGLLGVSTSSVAAWDGTATSSPEVAYIGDTVSYSLTIKNTGDSTLQVNSATLEIDWGAATTTKDMSGTVALAPGSSGTLTCSFQVPEVTPNLYTITIDVNGKAVGDWFAATKTYTTYITIREVPALTLSVSSATTSGQAPFTANLNSLPIGGVGPFTYDWTFGDGGDSTSQSPSHTYQQGGTYTATCTVTDSRGQSASDSITISVKGNPTDITDTSAGGGGSFGGISPLLIIGIVVATVAVIAVIFVVARKK